MKATFANAALACLLGSGLCRAAVTGAYAPPAFDHYQPILDRMPFGALPDNFGQAPVDPNAAKSAAEAAAEQQKLAKQVNMSAVNVTPGGQTAIGFTDLSVKPPVSHFLVVGDSADGWTVKSADYDDEIATIEKDGVAITLKLGKGLVDPATQPAPPAAAAAAAPPTPGPAARPGAPAPGAALTRTHGHPAPSARAPLRLPSVLPDIGEESVETRSYRERLLERKTQQSEAQIAADKKQQDALVKLAREAAQKEIARREEEAAAAEAEPPLEEPQEAPQEPLLPALEEGNVQ
jgi:hypothetical protein